VAELLCNLNYWLNTRVGVPYSPSAIYAELGNSLRGRALRLDGSHWLIYRSQLPYQTLNRVHNYTGGVMNFRYWCNEYDASCQQNLLEQAAFMLTIDLQKLVAEHDESIDTAERKLFEASQTASGRGVEAQIKNREKASKRLKEGIKAYKDAAQLYGLKVSKFAFYQIYNYANALELSQYCRTKEIARLAELAKGTAMEVDAATDNIPPEILADYLEEQGKDVRKARIALGQKV
jgi:hypothetical protein